ncbi:MAG: ATP-binding cassette domain-containing protein [Candidatus Dormibacteria bacterium]
MSQDDAAAQPAILIEGLSKSYGKLQALHALDLQVAKGELIAILGPNGAGKTTTVEILEGYRRQDSGRARVLGLDPRADASALRPLLGLMLQEGGVYPTLTVRESLRLFASFYRHPEDPDELLSRLGLEARARARYRQLSGGERQRLSLALALVGRPRVLFLDEPTAGMDPRARLLTWDIVAEARRAGATVVLTTHAMEEAERLADRVAILSRGRLVACASPAELRARAGSDALHLELERDLAPELLGELERLPGVEGVTRMGTGRYRLRTQSPRQVLAEVTALLRNRGPAIVLLSQGPSSLEEVFLSLTEEPS